MGVALVAQGPALKLTTVVFLILIMVYTSNALHLNARVQRQNPTDTELTLGDNNTHRIAHTHTQLQNLQKLYAQSGPL